MKTVKINSTVYTLELPKSKEKFYNIKGHGVKSIDGLDGWLNRWYMNDYDKERRSATTDETNRKTFANVQKEFQFTMQFQLIEYEIKHNKFHKLTDVF